MSWTEGWIAMESKIENLSILVTHSFEKLSNVLWRLFCYSGELYLGLQTGLDRFNLMQWSLQIVMLHLFWYSGDLYLGLQTWLDWLDSMHYFMVGFAPLSCDRSVEGYLIVTACWLS